MKKIIHSFLAGLMAWTLSASDAHAAARSWPVPLSVQQRSQWCWVAAPQMILRYRNRQYTEQCEIAELARSVNGAWGSTACCLNPDDCGSGNCCNKANVMAVEEGFVNPGSMPDLLSYHNIGWTQYKRSLTYAESKTEIENGNPFIVGWLWPPNSGHFVVVAGYSDATATLPDRLDVLNPAFGMGRNLIAYSAVVNALSGGNWVSTLTTGFPSITNDRATLCVDLNHGEPCLTTDTTTFVGAAFNDTATSIKVRGVPYILYENSNHAGAAWPVTPKNYYNPTEWGGVNDAVSSALQLPGSGADNTIVLFEHANYNGAYRIVTGDNPNLHNIGWGDRVSSLIVINRIWNLYNDANYGGLAYTVTSFGGPNRNGFYPDPASWGGVTDQASSVYYIPEGWNPIILYADVNLTGRALALWSFMGGGVQNNLTVQGFNDLTTSIKTYGDNWMVFTNLNQSGASQILNPNRWYPSFTDWGGTNDSITSVAYSSTGAW